MQLRWDQTKYQHLTTHLSRSNDKIKDQQHHESHKQHRGNRIYHLVEDGMYDYRSRYEERNIKANQKKQISWSMTPLNSRSHMQDQKVKSRDVYIICNPQRLLKLKKLNKSICPTHIYVYNLKIIHTHMCVHI